jgi:chemotaxis protein methyltransferase CheR
MEVLRRLVEAGRYASGLTLASIGCSSGAELYSTKWALHAARPDLQVFAIGVDLSGTAVAKAERAVYGLQDSEVRRLSSDQIEELSRGPFPLFQRQGDELIVPEALRTDVTWLVSDARDSRLAALLGAHDIVMVNNVLCHMRDQEAEACLRNVVRLVAPGGYLLIYGVNLDVRTFVVREAGLIPVMDDIERVYLADRSALAKWRLVYWGSEPFDGRRPDWAVRYGTVFQRPVYSGSLKIVPLRPTVSAPRPNERPAEPHRRGVHLRRGLLEERPQLLVYLVRVRPEMPCGPTWMGAGKL